MLSMLSCNSVVSLPNTWFSKLSVSPKISRDLFLCSPSIGLKDDSYGGTGLFEPWHLRYTHTHKGFGGVLENNVYFLAVRGNEFQILLWHEDNHGESELKGLGSTTCSDLLFSFSFSLFLGGGRQDVL